MFFSVSVHTVYIFDFNLHIYLMIEAFTSTLMYFLFLHSCVYLFLYSFNQRTTQMSPKRLQHPQCHGAARQPDIRRASPSGGPFPSVRRSFHHGGHK